MKLLKIAFLILLNLTTILCKSQENLAVDRSKPNVIYILADDLGYGDLSCYGQEKFLTPNIDKLAREGMLFTQHYAGSSVCAPSRSALMTGQDTGHTIVRGNLSVEPEGQWPIPKATFTIAELLKEKGYATGAFGKWGLGKPGSEGDPLQQGFDTFYGYNCQALAHNYYPDHLWNNENKILLSENVGVEKVQYAPTLIHNQALSFIEKHQKEPFFLYYASTLPHAELAAPQAYMDKFIGKFDSEKAFVGVDSGKNYRKGGYGSQPYGHAAFAAMITLLDDQVGEMVSKIKALGLEDNTIIIFTSDNGPHKEGGADPNYFNSNGPLRGYKRDLYEGGIRVPMIAKWKGKIAEGSKTDHISAFWDVMPTLAELTTAKITTTIEGVSFLPTLLKKGNQKQHPYLYWEFHELGGRQALRKGNWKLIRYNVSKGEKYQLYNLKDDIGETKDLADQNKELVLELAKILESSRTESEVFKF
ncbi:arylsulfatase [uncultured Flavobacterium sp.]|uniref:arylsulfatase n=1 Tax=uncultured Flavobacterium sp. TaxID=165435 RepID=UPI0030CA44DF